MVFSDVVRVAGRWRTGGKAGERFEAARLSRSHTQRAVEPF